MKYSAKALLLSAAMFLFLFTGCSSESAADSGSAGADPQSASASVSESQASSAEMSESASDSEAVSSSDAASSEKEEDPDAESPVSQNWDDLDIMVDGVVYKHPYLYTDLNAAGWSMSEVPSRGLGPHERLLTPFFMGNPKYVTSAGESCAFLGGRFANLGEEDAAIPDCHMWTFEVNVTEALRANNPMPEVEIAKNIHMGCTEEEIVAAFGPYESKEEQVDFETGKKQQVLKYESENGAIMRLTVTEDVGLGYLELKKHP